MRRFLLLFILCVAGLIASGAAVAQNRFQASGRSGPLASKSGRDIKFEVLSIRLISPDAPMTGQNFGPTPTGFASRLTIGQAIMLAYSSANFLSWDATRLRNLPNWGNDFYDFEARVPRSDLGAWQSQGKDHELLRAAMRIALKERCKLAIHEQLSKAPSFELVLNKSARLKSTSPDATLPAGMKLPGGGVMVQTRVGGREVKTCYGATMQDLAWFLGTLTRGIPVRDKTGLTGRYDFTLQQVDRLFADPEHPLDEYPVNHLGLKVKRAAEDTPMLVIDHIDRPTQN
jgi:uncharacterized protein (TIGR03435 family)